MPEMPDVVSSEPVEASWGNDIRDRTVQRYADATARDISVPFPAAGDLAYLDDSGTVTLFDGTQWRSGSAEGVYVRLIGDTMTGPLVIAFDDSLIDGLTLHGGVVGTWWAGSMAFTSHDDASKWQIGQRGGLDTGRATDLLVQSDFGVPVNWVTFSSVNDLVQFFKPIVSPAEAWTALPLGNGWGNFGDEFQVARYRHGTGRNSVEVQGLIKDGTIGSGTVIATLPAGFRPAATIRAVTTSNDVPVNFDVNAAGNIKIAGAGWSASWASLEFSFAIN